jgi:hypothetical protein
MDGTADLKSLYQISVAGNFPDPEVSACNIDPRSAKFVTPIVIPRRTVVCVGALLRLRPSKLSRCDAEDLTEMTREMALVGKAYGVCNLRK